MEQYNIHHTRDPSLPTVYEDNDPYRIASKKSPRLDSNSSDFDAIHSRTASDSSTSRLYSTNNEDIYSIKNKRNYNERANSYLPYSHHARDPNQPPNEPIYIDKEEQFYASKSLGVNSMLHDVNYVLPAVMPPATTTAVGEDKEQEIIHLSNQNRKRRKRACCGIRYPIWGFIIFIIVAIIAVVWYFVWPRIPNLALNDVDNVGNIQVITNSTIKSMSTVWQMNMTVDNANNWVPTHFNSIDFVITDDRTQQAFGNATTGSLVLDPRTQSYLPINMSIYYESSEVNDTTFQDLYNACGVQVTNNIPFDNQQDVLNVTLHVTYHVAGIVWATTKQMPIVGLICPTS